MMAEGQVEETQDEPTSWQYQVRDKSGEVIGDWVTPAGAEFTWPKLGKGQHRYINKGKRWQQIK